jgi:Dyp-type peroxidase family
MTGGQDVGEAPLPLAETVQAHLGRASRFAHGDTRNWSIFFFFRILTQAEVAEDFRRLGDLMKVDTAASALEEFIASMMDSGLMNTGIPEQASTAEYAKPEAKDAGQTTTAPDMPAQLFLDWLNMSTRGDAGRLVASLGELLKNNGVPAENHFVPPVSDEERSATEKILNDNMGKEVVELSKVLGELLVASGGPQRIVAALPALLPKLVVDPRALRGTLRASANAIGEHADARLSAELINAAAIELPKLFSNVSSFDALLNRFGTTAPSAGATAVSGGLALVGLYEILRHMAPAYVAIDDGKRSKPQDRLGIARHEGGEDDVPKPRTGKWAWDPAPINIAFTHSGLTALKLDEATLASFPDPFKEGMAARADRLGDTGPSAPEYWAGALGLKRVHGYFTGGFLAGDETSPVSADLWQALRDDVGAFNQRSGETGRNLRLALSILFRLIGMELVHVEIGEDPYEVGGDGQIKRPPYRTEHFGFRDGISQPFVNMRLGDTAPGGGTPRRNRTWAPVAPGEIFLDQRDEDGNLHQQPAHPKLRQGSTYLVFRKLEQDVAGLRIFLAGQRPRDPEAQEKLAAQFMGRWKNGTPLVISPDAPRDLGRDPGGLINDFLYAADDPVGRNCPLGAHVRRTNPRDIGGTDDVRRHRILRRSISYGGPLLRPDAMGDGNDRGLLFIAANARLDLQFEVIQADWINKGEFLGQAGLGRCPITGANDRGLADSFVEPASGAPVVGLPRFVTTRGGDYFFAPGLPALKALADGDKFVVDPHRLPYRGRSMGDAVTPDLFDRERLAGYAKRILLGPKSIVRVTLPGPVSPKDPASSPVVFVGRHADVRKVLSTTLSGGKIIHSVAQYQEGGRRIGRGSDLLIGTEPGSKTAAARDRLQQILNGAWTALMASGAHKPLAEIADRNILAALRRVGPSRKIDLVRDLATETAYGVLVELFGTPGPDRLSELVLGLPFARQHVGELSPEWLSALKTVSVDNPALKTMQVWSIAVLLDLVANYRHQQEIIALALQAGTEMLSHLDILIAQARAGRPKVPGTLVDVFVSREEEFTAKFGYPPEAYYADVRMLLLELAGTTMAVVPMAFGSIMNALFDFGIDLPNLLDRLRAAAASRKPPGTFEDGVHRVIYETTRLRPVFELLMRRCAQPHTLPSGERLETGEWVASLIGAANMDPRVHQLPFLFSLAPWLPGPARPPENYLLFGSVSGGRECWGRDRLALYLLQRCLVAAGRLERLQRVAGPAGEPTTLLNVIIGLTARFDRVRAAS